MSENNDNFSKPSRQVDVKALVSHIVQGDGMDRCRICLGDTSEGLVLLEDTVMVEEEQPVTLSELLQRVTGLQVVLEAGLPSAVCVACHSAALAADSFRSLVQNATLQWTNLTQLLLGVPTNKYSILSDQINIHIYENNLHIINTISESLKEELEVNKELPLKKTRKHQNCSCPACGKKFLYPLHLYQHLKESTDLVRACHICAEIMMREDLIVHLKHKHDVEPYSCERCPALFMNGPQLRLHTLKAHSSGAYACGDCGRTFRNRPAFHAHQTVHKLSSCPNCDTRFRNRSCYLHHVRKCCNIDARKAVKSKVTVTLAKKQNKTLTMGVRGSTREECVCDYCNKKFAGKKFVAAHIQIVHTRDTHRPCARCGKLFAAAHMTTHLRSHRPQTFECERCGLVLRSKLGFSQHLRLHTGEKPYACSVCGETFSAASRRSEHMSSVHGGSPGRLRHACGECPARFRLPSLLRRHLAAVHSGPDWRWECAHCKQKFASCRSLLCHTKKHKS